MAYISTSKDAQGGLSEKLIDMVRGLGDRAEKRRVFHQTYRELKALSLRELDDLGVNPSTLRSVAYQAAYGA